MILDEISKLNKVLVLGFAREGQSTSNFLHSKFPDLQIDHADQKDGPDYLSHLTDYSLVIKSPGVSPHKPEIVAAKSAGVIFKYSRTHITVGDEHADCQDRQEGEDSASEGDSTGAAFHSWPERGSKTGRRQA